MKKQIDSNRNGEWYWVRKSRMSAIKAFFFFNFSSFTVWIFAIHSAKICNYLLMVIIIRIVSARARVCVTRMGRSCAISTNRFRFRNGFDGNPTWKGQGEHDMMNWLDLINFGWKIIENLARGCDFAVIKCTVVQPEMLHFVTHLVLMGWMLFCSFSFFFGKKGPKWFIWIKSG